MNTANGGTMTIKELIDKLSQFPEDMEVMRFQEGDEYPGYNKEIMSVEEKERSPKNFLTNRHDPTPVVVIW